MVDLFQEIGALSKVEYINYRVALKLRATQRALLLDRVQYSHVVELLPPGAGPLDVVSTANLGGILAQLYNANPRREDTKQAKAMCMNFILMTFHCLSGGELTIRAVQAFVALLCAGTPLDKTKYLLMISGGKDHITKEHCAVFLDILTQIFSGFQEVFPVTDSEQLWSLGVAHREASESSVNLSRFAHLLAVSMPFQWLPTWQKLAISEDSVHQLGCGSCLRSPMVGLRYECVQCQGLNLCQMCHLTGAAASRVDGHKTDHQVQEYQSSPLSRLSWRQGLLCISPNTERGHLMQDEILPCSPPGGEGGQGLGTSRCSLESVSSGPPMPSPSHESPGSATLPNMTPPPCGTENECVAKQQWLRELVQQKKEMEQELQRIQQVRDCWAEVSLLQSKVKELLATRQGLSRQLGDLLGKVQELRQEQSQNAMELVSHISASETHQQTTLRRTQSVPRVDRAARAHRTSKETLV